MIPGPDYLAWLIYPKPSLLGFCSEFSQKSKGLNQTFYFLNFQGFTYCLIFNYQGSLLSCFQQLGYFIITFCACQELFKLFFCCSSATQSVYHVSLPLSTTFLFFSNSLFEPLFSQRNYNITLYPAIVKRICRFFYTIFPALYIAVFSSIYLVFQERINSTSFCK